MFSCTYVLMAVASLIAILLVLCTPALSNGQQCNFATHYTIYENSTGKTKCLNCPSCGPGLEPIPPCGSVVNATASVGLCQSCENGTTFSNENDHLPCKNCSKCVEHETVWQECDTEEDTQCSGKCDDGFVWNMNKCQPISVPMSTANPDVLKTTPAPKFATTSQDNKLKSAMNTPTLPPTFTQMLTTTVKPDPLFTPMTSPPKDKKSKIGPSHMASWKIWVIALGAIIGVLGVLGLYCCLSRRHGALHETVGKSITNIKQCISRKNRNEPAGEDLEIDLGGQRPFQEETEASTGVNTIAPTTESVHGYASSAPTTSRSDISPKLNRPVVVDEQVYSLNEGNLAKNELQQSPRVVPAAPVQRAQLAPYGAPERLNFGAQLARQAPHNACVQHKSPRLCELDFKLYHDICLEFDHGAPGKNCDALACTMNCFTAAHMRKFENKEKKADLLIQFWESIEGNDALTFVEILKAMDMTFYANRLAECIHGMNGDR